MSCTSLTLLKKSGGWTFYKREDSCIHCLIIFSEYVVSLTCLAESLTFKWVFDQCGCLPSWELTYGIKVDSLNKWLAPCIKILPDMMVDRRFVPLKCLWHAKGVYQRRYKHVDERAIIKGYIEDEITFEREIIEKHVWIV